MRGKKNLAENIDFSGDKWKLAPGGRDIVDKCQQRVYHLHIELSGYGALFRNLNNCDFSVEELYGVSLVLMRISKRLGKISDLLGQVTVEEKTEKLG